MRLVSIHINRGYFGKDPLQGKVEFASDDGRQEIKLLLDDRLSQEVVTLCSDAIARAGRQAAEAITGDALRTIEHKPDQE